MKPRRRRHAATAVVALAMLLALVAAPAHAQATDTQEKVLLVGIGAVAGALAFNLIAAPFGTVPFAGGALDAVPESIALGSRMVAVMTAGAGALGGLWLYDRSTGQQSDYGYYAALAGGAAAAVAAGNYLTAGTIGSLPSVGTGAASAAGSMATSTAQAASRVYVVGTAAVGAWAGDWLYRR